VSANRQGLLNALANVPQPDDVRLAIAAIEDQANDNIPNQHVVSQAILSRFTEPYGAKGELLLSGLTIDRPKSRPQRKGTDYFGKFPNYITFASRRAEHIWGNVENGAGAALQETHATDVGDPLSPATIDTLRDLVVLHFIRSIWHVRVHQKSWPQRVRDHRDWWLQNRPVVDEIHYQLHGLYPGGDERRIALVDWLIAEVVELFKNGSMFSVAAVERFERYRQAVNTWGVHLCHVTDDEEFLIGDTPALTVKDGLRGGVENGPGLLNCDYLVMPLSPKIICALSQRGGPTCVRGQISGRDVERYNFLQVDAAWKWVHFRTGSHLEEFIRKILPTGRPVESIEPDF
jgi:hypothetical protein